MSGHTGGHGCSRKMRLRDRYIGSVDRPIYWWLRGRLPIVLSVSLLRPKVDESFFTGPQARRATNDS